MSYSPAWNWLSTRTVGGSSTWAALIPTPSALAADVAMAPRPRPPPRPDMGHGFCSQSSTTRGWAAVCTVANTEGCSVCTSPSCSTTGTGTISAKSSAGPR